MINFIRPTFMISGLNHYNIGLIVIMIKTIVKFIVIHVYKINNIFHYLKIKL